MKTYIIFSCMAIGLSFGIADVNAEKSITATTKVKPKPKIVKKEISAEEQAEEQAEIQAKKDRVKLFLNAINSGNLDDLKSVLKENDELTEKKKLNQKTINDAMKKLWDKNDYKTINWLRDPESGLSTEFQSKIKKYVPDLLISYLKEDNVDPKDKIKVAKERHLNFRTLLEKNINLDEKYQLDEEDFISIWKILVKERIDEKSFFPEGKKKYDDNEEVMNFILKDLKSETQDSKLNKKFINFICSNKNLFTDGFLELKNFEERQQKSRLQRIKDLTSSLKDIDSPNEERKIIKDRDEQIKDAPIRYKKNMDEIKKRELKENKKLKELEKLIGIDSDEKDSDEKDSGQKDSSAS